MFPSVAQGDITTRNLASPNGNGVTAASTVTCLVGGEVATAGIQVRGTYTGALTVQVTLDGDLWVTLSGATLITNLATGVQTATIASAATGAFQVDVSGVVGIRVTGLAAMTGTASVTILGSQASGVTTLNGGAIALLAGSAAIGSVTNTPTSPTDFALTSAATTNATLVKANAGQLFEISADNFTASIKWLKLYRKASAPTVGTDVPILTIPIPANGQVSLAFGETGKKFLTGIAYAITGAQAVTDTTAVAAGDVHVHGSYI